MSDTETEVYHFAACEDCGQHVWVDSAGEAEIAAQKHHDQRGHSPVFGSIPENVIVDKQQPKPGKYND